MFPKVRGFVAQLHDFSSQPELISRTPIVDGSDDDTETIIFASIHFKYILHWFYCSPTHKNGCLYARITRTREVYTDEKKLLFFEVSDWN